MALWSWMQGGSPCQVSKGPPHARGRLRSAARRRSARRAPLPSSIVIRGARPPLSVLRLGLRAGQGVRWLLCAKHATTPGQHEFTSASERHRAVWHWTHARWALTSWACELQNLNASEPRSSSETPRDGSRAASAHMPANLMCLRPSHNVLTAATAAVASAARAEAGTSHLVRTLCTRACCQSGLKSRHIISSRQASGKACSSTCSQCNGSSIARDRSTLATHFSGSTATASQDTQFEAWFCCNVLQSPCEPNLQWRARSPSRTPQPPRSAAVRARSACIWRMATP